MLGDRPMQERLLWIKSWNEWAEGNYLEPDLEHGHARLRVLFEELQGGTPEKTEFVEVDVSNAPS